VRLGQRDRLRLDDPTLSVHVARASFELLVGFQLDQAQLAYNATR
jgi:hypothetical protein